jgi:hypothetical protein
MYINMFSRQNKQSIITISAKKIENLFLKALFDLINTYTSLIRGRLKSKIFFRKTNYNSILKFHSEIFIQKADKSYMRAVLLLLQLNISKHVILWSISRCKATGKFMSDQLLTSYICITKYINYLRKFYDFVYIW